MPSVTEGQHRFSMVPNATIPRSAFDRSFGHKTTFNAGFLVPVYVDEALPGDTFVCRLSAFARLATPLKPLMDNLTMETFFFAVPYRLVWENWERFNGAQTNPGESTGYVTPKMAAFSSSVGSIYDYMGIPPGVGFGSGVVSSLWFRAYNLIWNEWFRDQNLQNSLAVPMGDGPDGSGNFVLQRRGKRHDYFTSCLPFPQKGESVALPLSGNAPIIGLGKFNNVFPAAGGSFLETGGATVVYPQSAQIDSGGAAQFQFSVRGSGATGSPEIYANLADVTAATINDLRQAFQVQKLLERDARGGTRYVEVLKAHFGVTSPDARLQRPEYLGGGSSPVVVSPIAQTSSTDVTTPQGNLAAIGTASFSGHGFAKSFTEHCLLIGLVSVRADLNYQQGIQRMFTRSTRFDFYWPALAHIGEQAVLNREIYATATPTDDEVFGYQERFAEYRYKPSQISGLFRSTVAQSLDVWHLAQEFTALPTLSATFIQENPPVDRVIAVPGEPHFLFDSYFHLRCARPMPVYGVPGLIDHF